MVKVILKLKKKMIQEDPYVGYLGAKRYVESTMHRYGFESKGNGVYILHDETKSVIGAYNLIVDDLEFCTGMMDWIHTWIATDNIGTIDLMKWYNEHRRYFYETEFLPARQAYHRTYWAKKITEIKMKKKPKPTDEDDPTDPKDDTPKTDSPKTEEPEGLIGLGSDVPFDEEVPF